MKDALKNSQVFVVSNSSGNESWLRKDTCPGTCLGNLLQSIKKISIYTKMLKNITQMTTRLQTNVLYPLKVTVAIKTVSQFFIADCRSPRTQS